VIDRAAFNQGVNALFDPVIEITETAPPVIARGPCAVCFVFDRLPEHGAERGGVRDAAIEE